MSLRTEETVRLKHVAWVAVSNVDKKSVEGEREIRLCNYTDVYYNDLIIPDLSFMKATASESQIRQFTLKAGDVLITKDSETPDDIAVPAFVPDGLANVLCGYHLALIRPQAKRVYPKYLYWTLASAPTRERFSSEATGVTRFGLRADSIANALLRLPDQPTQSRIADFLDAETAWISALIEQKKRMIGVMKERLDAITRQLAMGADAEPVPLRWHIRLSSGESISPTDLSSSGEVPVIGGNGVMGFTDREPTITEPVIAVGRVGALCGNVHLVDPPAWITDNALWIRGIRRFNRGFLAAALRSSDLNSLSMQTAQPLITGETIKRLRVPCPDQKNQAAIADRLVQIESWTEAVIARLRTQIELLREHRQALITAAVTGELDLAGAV